MQRDELKIAMKAWGDATVNRISICHADRSTHQLARVAHDKPMPKKDADRKLIERSGYSRRVRMAKSVQIAGVRCVPLWACDASPARNDADRPHDNPQIAVDMGIPDELLWIEHAVCQMDRQHPMRALIVRVEFTVALSQEIKARMVQEKYGGALTVWQYRAELDRAMAWIVGARDVA
jgi:hypothetical protein